MTEAAPTKPHRKSGKWLLGHVLYHGFRWHELHHKSEYMCHWGYTHSNGPKTWQIDATGERQSPIDIRPDEALFDDSLVINELKPEYTRNAKQMVNTGRSLQVVYDIAGSSLTGGPLSYRYKLVQFHFHWGKTSQTGSEHTVNGREYSAELHLVHMNTDRYDDFSVAARSEDGLCVLGVFLEVGDFDHPALQQLAHKMTHIKHSTENTEMDDGFDPSALLPSDTRKYWTYPGSLTTPPCYESVTWIVFNDPIQVSENQLACFRNLKEYSAGETPDADDEFCGHIVENYRPPQPLGNRTIRASFRY